MKTYIITGATGSLGRTTATFLAQQPETRVILAVRNTDRGRSVAAEIGQNAEVAELDLGSFDSIDAFISSWQGNITGLINNAGIQIVNETRFTKKEGFEETFAVNHLAALKLTMSLLPFLEGGRVLFIGSGTHNPKNRAATIFGFRGARFTSIQQCAEGRSEAGSIKQIGMDRYATSKFLNMVTTVEFARRMPPERVSFFCLDPGLMAGTGLARAYPAPLRFAWAHFLPLAAKLLPDTSTPTRSGEVAAWIVTSKKLAKQTGTIFSFDYKPSTRVWEKVFDPEIGKAVIDDSLNLLKLRKRKDLAMLLWESEVNRR